MLSSIPFRTFPSFQIGPVRLQTFGLFVAIGIIVGVWVFLRFARSRDMDPQALSGLAWRVVIFGLIGSRVLYVITHAGDYVDRPFAVFAVWEGGLQFSGAFLIAIAVILWWLRKHPEVPGMRLADGLVLGLVPGLMIGRIGCASVGEHLGGTTEFFLGWKYLGGETREGSFAPGTVLHSTAIYEIVLLAPLLLLMLWMAHRRVRDGWITVTFLLWYGVQRLLTDFLRAYDQTFLGLTGAQFIALGMIAGGLVMAYRLTRGGRAEAEGGLAAGESAA